MKKTSLAHTTCSGLMHSSFRHRWKISMAGHIHIFQFQEMGGLICLVAVLLCIKEGEEIQNNIDTPPCISKVEQRNHHSCQLLQLLGIIDSYSNICKAGLHNGNACAFVQSMYTAHFMCQEVGLAEVWISYIKQANWNISANLHANLPDS